MQGGLGWDDRGALAHFSVSLILPQHASPGVFSLWRRARPPEAWARKGTMSLPRHAIVQSKLQDCLRSGGWRAGPAGFWKDWGTRAVTSVCLPQAEESVSQNCEAWTRNTMMPTGKFSLFNT